MPLLALPLLAALCLLLVPAPLAAQPAAGPALTLQQLRALRAQAAHRPRRMIFNNDGDDVIYYQKEPTAEALLARRTTPLLGSQVDSIFYSNSLCFGSALHASRVFEPFTSREDLFKDNAMGEYLARGLDPIAVMADFCHRNGLEIFWDMRMNDTHDAGLSGYGPLLLPKLKRDHPEYLVGSPDKQPPYGTWSSVNYAVPEVRELAYRFFEEVCGKFDVDGLELDFLRHACFFKSVAWGGEAGEEERELMTDLLRRTRALTEREGLRRGRPILLAIRVPDSVDYCRAIGLDLERWLSEGLVDVLIGSCYFQLNPWEYLVGLGHKYGVPVYPSLSESRVQGESRFQRQSLPSYRARAAAAWAAGVDGIYLFNCFDPRSALWRELGDPTELKTKDKLYFLSPRNGPPNAYLKDGVRFRQVPVVTPQNPALVAAGRPLTYTLHLAEDLGQEARPTVTCHVRVLAVAPLQVALNGRALAAPRQQDDWLDFAVPLEALKAGPNTVTIAAPAAAPAAEAWTVSYRAEALPGPPWQKMGWANGCLAELREHALLIADRSTEGGSYGYFAYPGFIDPGQESVVEARLKTIAGESSILLENGVSGEQIQFYPDRVCLRHVGLSAPARTDEAFHTYRLVTKGTDLRLYMDDRLLIDGTGRFTPPAPNGRSGVMFGASNSGTTGEALWEAVRVRNLSATLLDLVLEVDYAGQ